MDEDPLALENVRLRDQLRKDAEALKELRLEFDEYRREREELDRELDEYRREREELDRELDELRRERGYERQQAEARLNQVRRRAEAAEKRVGEFEAQSGEGIPGRLSGLCEAVQRTVSRAVPPRLWRLTFGRLSSWPRTR
jgi:chromosome segregation ATPase